MQSLSAGTGTKVICKRDYRINWSKTDFVISRWPVRMARFWKPIGQYCAPAVIISITYYPSRTLAGTPWSFWRIANMRTSNCSSSICTVGRSASNRLVPVDIRIILNMNQKSGQPQEIMLIIFIFLNIYRKNCSHSRKPPKVCESKACRKHYRSFSKVTVPAWNRWTYPPPRRHHKMTSALRRRWT